MVTLKQVIACDLATVPMLKLTDSLNDSIRAFLAEKFAGALAVSSPEQRAVLMTLYASIVGNPCDT